jgi:hypothetical protein
MAALLAAAAAVPVLAGTLVMEVTVKPTLAAAALLVLAVLAVGVSEDSQPERRVVAVLACLAKALTARLAVITEVRAAATEALLELRQRLEPVWAVTTAVVVALQTVLATIRRPTKVAAQLGLSGPARNANSHQLL